MYKKVGASCDLSSFDKSQHDLCKSGHIYQNDVESYGNSFVSEYDLGHCNENNWPLDPYISKVAFLGMAYMIGMMFGG